MAGLREIQNRIKSIQDTRKITNAMYMISSTKMRKAKQDLENTEPYFYTLQSMMARLLRHLPDVSHMYFEKEEKEELDHQKKVGLLVITGDKGLAGAYNHNVLKLAQEFLDDQDQWAELYVVGELGRQYFVGQHVPIQENFQFTAQNPTFSRAVGLQRHFWKNFSQESWMRSRLFSHGWRTACPALLRYVRCFLWTDRLCRRFLWMYIMRNSSLFPMHRRL